MSIQQKITYFSIGGILLYCWALFSTEVLLPSLTRIAALFVAIIVLLTLYVITVVVAVKMNRKRNGKDGLAVALAIVAACVFASFFATTFVLDSGIGAGLREQPGLAFLPEGNLLVAGGRAGWTLFVLSTTIVVCLLWDKLKAFKKPSIVQVSNPSNRTLEQPKLPVRDEPKPYTQHAMSRDTDTGDLFGSMS